MARAYRILLDGAQENPANASTASGIGYAIYDDVANTLRYELSISGLDFGGLFDGGADETPDPSDDVTAAHIHNDARGINGPVVFNLFTQDADDFFQQENADGTRTLRGMWETTDPASSPITNFTFELGSGVIGNDVNLYFNVHTAGIPGGEIRGQFVTMADDNANVVNGTNANDFLAGVGGDDTLNGGIGNDVTDGGAGDDVHFVDSAGDVVVERAGEGVDDRVATNTSYALGSGVDVEVLRTTANGGLSNINLTGNEVAQTIIGNAGNNVIADGGGAGADILRGLGGNDTYIVRNAGSTIIESAVQGTNDRVATAVNYTLGAGVDIELFTTTSTGSTKTLSLTGNELSQTIIGNAGVNVLRSGTGAPDVLRGLGGNDVYRVFNSGDDVIEVAGQGTFDRVVTTVAYGLAAGVDIERLQTDSTSGTDDFNLIGNEVAQSIIGNAGINYIRGRGGDDVLYGMLGNDRFVFYASDFAGGVNDVIKDFHEAAGDTDVLRLQGSAADYAFADVGANLQVTHNATGGVITVNNFSVAQLDAAQTSYFA